MSFLQNWTNKYHSTKQNNLLKYTGSSLQNCKNKYFYYSTKQKNSLNILGLLCRFEEINIFIILPSKKNPEVYWIFFAELKKKSFYHSTKHKNKSLNILGLLWRVEKSKYFYYSTKRKNSLNILGLFCRIEKINISIFYHKPEIYI